MERIRHRLPWYLNRLRSMSAVEIGYRINQLRRRRGWRKETRGWSAFEVGDGTLTLPAPLSARLHAPQVPDLAERIGAARKMAESGRFAFLEATWPAPSEPGPVGIPWLLDPVSGKDWPGPDTYCFDANYRHACDRGDVKFVWELNRLQFLPALAFADARANGHAVMDVLASWMAANPPFRGINWNSGIELALRIVSLAVTLLVRGPPQQPEDRARVRQFLAAHAFWVHRFPSLHSSANNHLLAEGLGLLLAGLIAPDLPDAAVWEAYGRATVERETLRQFGADGVGLEQSPKYTAFSAELVCFADLYAASCGAPLDPRVRARLEHVARWLRTIMDEGGDVPRIGDDDEGRVIALPPDREPHYVASVLAALAGHLGMPHLAPPRHDAHLRDLLFDSPQAPGEAPDGLTIFPKGGYTVLRRRLAGRQALLVFDHGPLGYLSIAAHGHADALAVWLHLDDAPVIVDAGTYLYHSGTVWRDALRRTSLHNTLMVEDADSSTVAGPFIWSKKAEARLIGSADASPWTVIGEHNGYRERFGAMHQRRLSGLQDGFRIEDRLAGAKAPLAVAASLLFHPDCVVEPNGEGVFRVSRQGEALLEIETPAGFGTEIARGDEVRKLGWYSPRFGAREPAQQLIWRGQLGEAWQAAQLRVLARSPAP